MRYRLARAEDLNAYEEILEPGFRASPHVRHRLIDIWRTLLLEDRALFVTFEDEYEPRTIEAAAITSFAQETFVHGYLKNPRPYLAAEVYEKILGGRSPLLTPQEVRAANSGRGLEFIALHFMLRHPDLDDPRTQEVLMAANAAFFFFHHGYRMNSILQEVYGRDKADYLENAGFRPLDDFADYFALRADEPPDPKDHPYLLRLGKEDIVPAAVTPLSFLFHPRPTRIYFSTAERKVLERALLGQSDEELSASLGVSVDTIKMTWRRVYQRVDREMPQLLGSDAARKQSPSRGSEKRRRLLDYLRNHLEELRPAVKPSTREAQHT
ncbi:MAG TPA: hypothetical protein VNN10_13545 [Dehalococcoidia bacterium]|nr:hypothetical protein [Dehalococcoidia bacterium]